ncbi:MAG TPA: type II secretion system protein [Burkholderiales bacterium]|jgi:type II secretory pathway pseudopilin PulG|nr:type II secretion system protein [Burkholderiales bacterium]
MRSAGRPVRGFTLLGVVLLVAILAIGAAATLSAGIALQQRAAEQELLFVGGEYQRAFRSYYETAVSTPRYPLKLEELLRDPRFPGVRRHLRRLYADPLTGKSEWGLIQAPGGGIMGVYSLATGTPIKVDLFDARFPGFEGKTSYAQWRFAYAPPGFSIPSGPGSGSDPGSAPPSGPLAGDTAAPQAPAGNPGAIVPQSSVRK